MKSNLMTFTHEVFGNVRGFTIEGKPYFVAKDIADILEYSETSKMLRRLDKDDKIHYTKQEIQTALSGLADKVNNNGMVVITEPGFYNAVFGSEKDEAKVFQKWVTHEVLPALRNDGLYIMENATSNQKRYHPEMINETFKTCSIEHIEDEYNKCIEHHKNLKTRLPYKRTSDTRRIDKRKTIAESKLEIMTEIEQTIVERKDYYVKNGQFEFAHVTSNLLKIIKDEIRTVQHNRTKGKLAAKTKKRA
jgi:prophage antirepressor-like protein